MRVIEILGLPDAVTDVLKKFNDKHHIYLLMIINSILFVDEISS